MSKTAIATGAADGLGKGIAERLANDRLNTVLQDISKALLLEAEKELKKKGYQAVVFKDDISKKREQKELVRFVATEFGQLSVMVNDTGADAVTPILEIGEEELSKLPNINVFGILSGVQAAANQFIRQKSKGKITNICNTTGHESYEVLDTCSATRHPVRSFAQTAVKGLADKGITVNAYCLGVAKTKMWDRVDEEVVKLDDSLEVGDTFKTFSSEIKLGRYQESPDAANLVSFLISNDPNYITSQSILADGGLVYR